MPLNDNTNWLDQGEYSALMNTAYLPAEVYLYRLEAGEDRAVKKMVITK